MKNYQEKIIEENMDDQKTHSVEILDRNDRMYNYNRNIRFVDFLRMILGLVFLDLLFFGSYILVFGPGDERLLLMALGTVSVIDLFLWLINKLFKSTFLDYLFLFFHPGFFLLVNMAFIGLMYSNLDIHFYYYSIFIVISLILLLTPFFMSIEKCEAALRALKAKPDGEEQMKGKVELRKGFKQKSFRWIYYAFFLSLAFPLTRWVGVLALYVYVMVFISFRTRISAKKYKDQKKGLVQMDDFVAQEAELKDLEYGLDGLEELDKLYGLESLEDLKE